MTEITDSEAAEVLWASSERGEAAVKRAWEKARRLDHCTQRTSASPPWSGTSIDQVSLDIFDVRAIVYAAYLAAGWDAEPMEDEPAPAHDHQWVILGAQPDARMLPGEWTLETLQAAGEQR